MSWDFHFVFVLSFSFEFSIFWVSTAHDQKAHFVTSSVVTSRKWNLRFQIGQVLHFYVHIFFKKKETSIVKFVPTANLFSAAGFSLWSWWSACSKTCGSFGVAGTQERTRICIKRILGCEGQVRETRKCNPEACQGKESPYGVTWSKTRGGVFLLIIQNKKLKENGT